MEKKLFAVSCLLFLFSFAFYAESNDKKSIEIKFALGWSFGCYKETTFANISQSILSPRYQLETKIKSSSFLHTINADYFVCNPESAMTKTAVVYKSYDPVSGENYYKAFQSNLTFHKIKCQYDLNYQFIEDNKFDFYAGSSFLCNAFLQFEQYPSISGLFSLALSSMMTYRKDERNLFSFNLALPLCGYGVRPPYAGCDARLMKYAEEDFLKILTLGSFLSLHNYQSILLNCEYKVRSSKHFSTGLGCDFEYARIAEPKERPLYYVNANVKTFVIVHF